MEKFFEKGDFVKYSTYSNSDKVTFGIFEGVDLEPQCQYAKKYSLVLYYDSNQYCPSTQYGGATEYRPTLNAPINHKPCAKTIDTVKEDNWWKLCTEEDKKKALEILESYGYEWNEELLALVDMESGEIVYKIVAPRLAYHGETIRPIPQEFKDKLKKSIIEKVKTTPTTRYPYYGEYD